MPSTMTPTTVSPEQVLLYIPNLIGYGRVLCTLAALVLMILVPDQYWSAAIVLYVTSFVGDLFDGMAARHFHQSSSFGGLLDMVTDRCSTLGILYVLGTETNESHYRLVFVLLMILDIASHWCQMYSTTRHHHKSAASNQGRNVLVQWYYQYYWFFGYCCVGAEFTYIFLYIQIHLEPESMWSQYDTLLLYACIPACLMKQVVNLVQLTSACHAVASYDANQSTKINQVNAKPKSST